MPFPNDDDKLAALSQLIRNVSEEAYRFLLDGLLQGIRLDVMIERTEQKFGQDVLDAIAEYYALSLGIAMATKGHRAYYIGEVSLSALIYDGVEEVSKQAKMLINRHLKGYIRSRDLMLQLFEGYDFREEEVLKVRAKLPKYLKGPAAEIQVGRLRTPALRASYLALLDAKFEAAAEAELARVARVAWFEKARYFADRIARTETARAVHQEDAKRYMSEEQLSYLQIRLSAAHPVTDICDLHAGLNAYGLGPGVYPKAAAPMPPYHPHCFCRAVPRYDLEGREPRFRKGSDRAFVRRLKAKDQGKVMGSREKADRLLTGGKLLDIIDENKKRIYKTKFVGEFK